jgi:Kip1 ubiquitination-promoting complex protein 1
VGWCTRDCQFSEENGVGDTPDSYSYDGNRVRKWNVATYRYGEPWLSGDIIGVTMDCDKQQIEFYRNGRPLGVAFDNVKFGPGVAYFPGVSLGDGENLVANFGATPFKHPVKGARPLQDPPDADVKRARHLMGWLDNLLEAYETPAPKPEAKAGGMRELPSRNAVIFLVGSKIFRHLSPLLVMPYVVESVLMPFLESSKRINGLLNLMWALMEEHELTRCLEYVCISLLTRFRQSASGGDFPNQKIALRLLREILSHQRTRKLLLKNVFFERIRFPTFMHLKPLDDEALKASCSTHRL